MEVTCPAAVGGCPDSSSSLFRIVFFLYLQYGMCTGMYWYVLVCTGI